MKEISHEREWDEFETLPIGGHPPTERLVIPFGLRLHHSGKFAALVCPIMSARIHCGLRYIFIFREWNVLWFSTAYPAQFYRAVGPIVRTYGGMRSTRLSFDQPHCMDVRSPTYESSMEYSMFK